MAQASEANVEERYVNVEAGTATLEGNLSLPQTMRGVVIFAHGSGSSRHSPRNQYVADVVNQAGLATLLFDLLTADEEAEDMQTGQWRFNIPFLADRLVAATEWLLRDPELADQPIGYFGASTGAAAALEAVARTPGAIAAVVSRGGRPDMVMEALPAVDAPTLLIVGGKDRPVISMNERALAQLPGEKKLEIIPSATHLFPEPGALEEVARLAMKWFEQHLPQAQA